MIESKLRYSFMSGRSPDEVKELVKVLSLSFTSKKLFELQTN
jgi:hypothetical protein